MISGNELQKASVYTDFNELANLRHGAEKNSPEALKKAAQQFEAMFMQMMLKSMREAGGEENGLFDSDQTRLYQDMYDKQLSLSLSEGDNGIGLAKMLVQQLQSRVSAAPSSQASADVAASQAVPSRGTMTFALQPKDSKVSAPPPVSAEPEHFDSPEQFVSALWPHAVKTGQKLGVDPRAILAQAALETGWGKAVIQAGDGKSSHNLFNIKADQRWDGAKVVKQTLEYRDGVAVKEQAGFRAYGSWAESFDDYAAFLKGSGRYHEALSAGSDGHRFAEQLQDAGYATDPAYARKIKQILNNDLMVQAASRTKAFG